jgi:hypothetical protein
VKTIDNSIIFGQWKEGKILSESTTVIKGRIKKLLKVIHEDNSQKEPVTENKEV